MEHALNVKIATGFDTDTAIFLQNIKHWTLKNLANKKHIHDGFCWTYNSLSALCDLFPYWSKRQIERIINNCIKNGLLVKGNYNQTTYDRTCWYAMTAKTYWFYPELSQEKYLEILYLSISPNREMDFTEWRNRFPQTVTTIPDTKTDTKTDTNNNNICTYEENFNLSYTEFNPMEEKQKSDYFDNQENTKNKQILSLEEEGKSTKSDYCENQLKNKTERKKSNQYTLENILNNNPFQIPIEMIQDYQINRKNKRAPITATSWNMINKQLAKCKERNIEPQEAFETMVARGWQSMNVEWVTPNSNKNNSCGDSLSRVMSKYNTQHGGVYDQHGNSFDPLR